MFRRSTSASRILLALMALVSALFVASSSGVARAADYPTPTQGQGQVDSTTVEAGQCVQFSGGGFKPGTPVTIKDDGKVVGTTTADANGNFTYPVCFGTNARHGVHTLTAEGLGGNGAAHIVTSLVTVLGISVTTPVDEGTGGGLPFTGADVRDLSLLGGGLVLVGAFLVVRGNKTRRARRIGASTSAA